MKIKLTLHEYEFDKIVKAFAYRYFIDFKKVSAIEYECVFMVKPFMKHVEHKSTTIRMIALTVLGEAKYSEAMPLFFNALNDRSLKVRDAAAFFLGQFQDRAALRPLMLAVRNNSVSYDNYHAVVEILGQDLEHEMVKALGDDDYRVRLTAGVVLLNRRKIPDCTQGFIKALNSKNRHVRLLGAKALGYGDSISAVGALINKLKAGEIKVNVHRVTIEALDRKKSQLECALKEIEVFSGKKSLTAINLN
jgi:HEAT repeat protein